MANSGKRRCANCDYENDSDAPACTRCGASLEGATTVATAAAGAIDLLEPLIQPPTLSIGEVMFLIAGRSDPVTLQIPPGQDRIVLGRHAEEDAQPDLDLTAYGLVAGSVSRRHAALHFSGDKPTIEDLGSTNGTWLNENRLIAYKPHLIRTGDLLRLGQQFIFVYFSTGITTVDTIILIDPRETGTAAQRLTPDDLTQHVGSYLHALEGIQAVVSRVLGQLATGVSVNNLDLQQAPALIRVNITGASGAIRLVLATMGHWRKRHAVVLNELWQLDPGTVDGAEQAKNLQTALSGELSLLADDMLKRLASHLAAADQAAYAGLLLPHVHTIALHTLELSVDRPG